MSSVLDFPAAPSVTAAVQGLRVALASVASLVAAGRLELLPESELLAVAADLQALSSQLDAVAVSAVAEVRDGDLAERDGFSSTTRWLEARAGLSKGQSRAAVALGERLQWEFQATRSAWLAGEISEGAVQAITTLIPRRLKALPDAGYAATRAELEAMALHHARNRPVADVRRAIVRAAIVADPVGAEAAVLAAKASEFLSFTPVEDGVEVRGFLSWETAGVLLPAFDQCHDAMYRNGRLAADHVDGLDGLAARTPGLRRRRREHRNAQILAELATHLLDDGALGTKHAQRPHVTVTVHADDHAAGLGGDVLLPGFGPVPVPSSTIDRILCDAEVHPVLTRRPPSGSADSGRSRGADSGPVRSADPDLPSADFPGSVPRSTDPPWRPVYGPSPSGALLEPLDTFGVDPTEEQIDADTDVAAIADFAADLDDRLSWWNRFLGEPVRHVLDVGRSFRTAPPKIRRALTVRDGGCAAPDCDADPSRCEAHHITYWEHHGETSVSNMVLLCARHHHMVHEGRWRIDLAQHLEPGDPGYVTLVAPSRRTGHLSVPDQQPG